MSDQIMNNCILCPRMCHADRSSAPGYCGCPACLRAARAGLHYWEEPFLSGVKGSGTVFFTGCGLGCIYCQNSAISGHTENSENAVSDSMLNAEAGSFGIDITTKRLAEIFLELQAKGAHNINLVTGTPYIPFIAEALKAVKDTAKTGSGSEDGKSLSIPVIWNSGGYERAESLQMLEGLVDIWLPDFKTLSPELGMRYMNAPDYPEAAMEALAWMVQIAGPARFVPYTEGHSFFGEQFRQELRSDPACLGIEDPSSGHACQETDDPGSGPAYTREDIEESGLMVSGVCVRHLVIPGQIEDSRRVLRYLHETFGDKIWISLMSQYTPMRNDFPQEELNRRVSEEEYESLVDYAIDLGIENCMIQSEEAAQESFIPVFDGSGL